MGLYLQVKRKVSYRLPKWVNFWVLPSVPSGVDVTLSSAWGRRTILSPKRDISFLT
jgi:hypothetical protein